MIVNTEADYIHDLPVCTFVHDVSIAHKYVHTKVLHALDQKP